MHIIQIFIFNNFSVVKSNVSFSSYSLGLKRPSLAISTNLSFSFNLSIIIVCRWTTIAHIHVHVVCQLLTIATTFSVKIMMIATWKLLKLTKYMYEIYFTLFQHVFMNKRILYKPLVSRFSYFLCCYCHKNSIKIPSKFDNSNIIFLNINLIANKRVRALIFLFWVRWSSYLQHISTTSLKSEFEKWPVTVCKCALLPGRCLLPTLPTLIFCVTLKFFWQFLYKHY